MSAHADRKLEVAVHSAPDLSPANYAPGWIEALESLGVTVRARDFLAPDVIDDLRGVDGAMWHYMHSPRDRQAAPMILGGIESGLGIPVFPNHATRWHFDEKIAQHYLLESVGAPAVKTWVFWDRESASRFVERCAYPIVFKLSLGAGSANVRKLETPAEARRLVERMFERGVQGRDLDHAAIRPPRSASELKAWLRRAGDAARYLRSGELPQVIGNHHVQKHYLYLQEFVPDNPCDIRVTVIGDRAFGFRRWNRPGDFRASGSGLIDWDREAVPEKAVRIAHRISRDRGFQSMAYDFLIDAAGEPRICEISYGYVSGAVRDCPGHWDPDLVWHPGRVQPERAHVEDFVAALLRGGGA